jgi:hypothetical protein
LESLRCNNCAFLKEGFCIKIGEALPHRLAKLFFGGAEGLLLGTVTYASECGVEKQEKPREELQLLVFVPESQGDEEMLEDPALALDNADW